jgi:hydrogenase-4 component F
LLQSRSLSSGCEDRLRLYPRRIWNESGIRTDAYLAPDGHSKPSPISALMSGVLLNVALLAILRFSGIVKVAGAGDFVIQAFLFFGVFSVALSAFIMFVQKNYKRLLASSSIDNMGILALGFAFGGLGPFAALLHALYHSLLKSLLFLSAGNIFVKYGSTKIVNIRGVFQTLPLTGILFFGGFLALGLPPFECVHE